MKLEESAMSKYAPLWNWIQKNGEDSFKLTFAKIEQIAGVPLDHSIAAICLHVLRT